MVMGTWDGVGVVHGVGEGGLEYNMRVFVSE